MSRQNHYGGRQNAMSAQQIDPLHTPSKNDVKSLANQNRFIKKQNDILRKQLENISIRLDGEIKKRLQQQKKKPLAKVEDISQMELQNAYKKCQIYKKQISFYKKKLQSIPDVDRFQEYEKKISEKNKENQLLRDQLKQIKKISKLQEKGLAQIGGQGYLKLVAENQKLHEQIRILKKQNDDERRGKIRASKHRTQTQNFNYNSSKIQAKITDKDIKFQQQVKKKIRTQSNNQPTQQDLNEVLQQKVEKDYAKIKALMNQKTRLREMVDNLKLQLAQKDKQLATLRQKIIGLRKNNQVLQTQVNSRVDNNQIAEEIQNEPKNKIKKSKTRLDSNSRQRVWKKQPISDGEDLDQESIRKPQTQQKPSKNENNIIKWSHQSLSSKIKSLQIVVHETGGHIKNIHPKYQKGQPKKYDFGKGKAHVITCGDDQYIKYVKGCFFNHYLQYIVITTSRKRVEKFGNWKQFQNGQQGQVFEFEIDQGQFPGGLFGENDQVGVRKLGCFIHKQA